MAPGFAQRHQSTAHLPQAERDEDRALLPPGALLTLGLAGSLPEARLDLASGCGALTARGQRPNGGGVTLRGRHPEVIDAGRGPKRWTDTGFSERRPAGPVALS